MGAKAHEPAVGSRCPGKAQSGPRTGVRARGRAGPESRGVGVWRSRRGAGEHGSREAGRQGSGEAEKKGSREAPAPAHATARAEERTPRMNGRRPGPGRAGRAQDGRAALRGARGVRRRLAGHSPAARSFGHSAALLSAAGGSSRR